MGACVMFLRSSPSRIRRDFRPGRHLVVLWSVAWAPAVRAAEPSIRWDAPAECSDVRQVMAVVAELTGHDPVTIPPEQQIRGRVEAKGGGWQLTLTSSAGRRERERVIAAPSCPELVRAAGVALALAIDPAGVLGAPSAGAAPGPIPGDGVADRVEPLAAPGNVDTPSDDTRATVVSTEMDDADADAARPAPPELEWRLELDALLDAAALGAAAPGMALSLGARHDALTGFVYGAWLPARRQGVDGSGAVEFALGAGGLRGCYEIARGLLAADACTGVELGRLTASGEGLDNAASFSDWWLAPSVGLALGSALAGRVYFRASADAVLPVLREAYRVNDGALVHRAPSVGFRGGVALGVTFGAGG